MRYDSNPIFPQAPKLPSLYEQLLSAPGDKPADTGIITLLRGYDSTPAGFLSRLRERFTRRDQHK